MHSGTDAMPWKEYVEKLSINNHFPSLPSLINFLSWLSKKSQLVSNIYCIIPQTISGTWLQTSSRHPIMCHVSHLPRRLLSCHGNGGGRGWWTRGRGGWSHSRAAGRTHNEACRGDAEITEGIWVSRLLFHAAIFVSTWVVWCQMYISGISVQNAEASESRILLRNRGAITRYMH